MANNYPNQYLQSIKSASKPLNMTFEIDGLETIYSIAPLVTEARYGDPDLFYGEPDLFYGELIQLQNNKAYISTDSSSTISQRLEPEQGRASISTMTIVLVDKNGEVSQVVSPGGGILPEIMGRDCLVRVGFQNTNYPTDYYVAFRGLVTNVISNSGKIIIATGDKNQKRRENIFTPQNTTLTSDISDVDTMIPVADATGFYENTIQPDLSTDDTVTKIIKIDDEYIIYSTINSLDTVITAATRGARGTTPAAHSAGTAVDCYINLEDHPLVVALKLMCSGFLESDGVTAAPYLSDLSIVAVGTRGVTVDPTAIVLDVDVNADIDYGLVIGDWVMVTGSTSGNNGTFKVTEIISNGDQPLNVILTTGTFTLETSDNLRIAIISQYNTYPDGCGLSIPSGDIDIAGHQDLINNFLTNSYYIMNLFMQDQQSGKSFCESELYFPIACYSLTRFGRLSVNQTRPPIAQASLQFVSIENIVDAPKISTSRGLNSRTFYNSIQYQYDQDDAGNFQKVLYDVSTDSLNAIGLSSQLPIASIGIKHSLGGDALIQKVSTNLLTRYQFCAVTIELTVNFQIGTLIESGDVIALQDNGTLHITNFATGKRDMGTQLFEVINRTLDLKTGQVQLTLVSGIAGQASDRFGTISPSSRILTGSTASMLKIASSYAPSEQDETIKWQPYVGSQVLVRSDDWTQTDTSNIAYVDDSVSPFVVGLTSTLSFIPTDGFVLDVPPYPNTANTFDNQIYKISYAFLDPLVSVSGTSATGFMVSSTDIAKFKTGAVLYVRNQNFTIESPEVTVTSVDTVGYNVGLKSSLGFIPSASGGFSAELIGFPDGGSGYRIY